MTENLVWITGATEGIGLELARHVPFPDARIINVSRREHPDFESVVVDMTDPSSWEGLRRHLDAELAMFAGRRALFVQNAYWSGAHGRLLDVEPASYRRSILANVAAPLAFGEMFVRACRPGYESGLVMVSSGAAVSCLDGLSTYGAGKIAIEHWAQIVDQECSGVAGGPWVVAVRAGGVLTAPVQRVIDALDPSMPNAAHIRDNALLRLSPSQAALEIWKSLPPPPGVSLINLASPPDDPALSFGGERELDRPVPGWRLVYR